MLNKVVLCLLACAAGPGVEARAVSHLRTELRRNNPIQDVAKGVQDAGKDVAKAVTPGTEKKDEKKGEKKEEKKDPVDPIAAMRGQLCAGQKDIVGHDDCMKFLVKTCEGQSFGNGLCKKTKAAAKERCLEKGDKKACKYAKGMGVDVPADTDSDRVFDKHDAFPTNANETKDTDGDGVGDNADEAPNDPLCQKKPCPKPPAPAPASKAPAPAPEKAAEAPAPAEAAAAPGVFKAPVAKEGLQSQGFSGDLVVHTDGKSMTSDWGNEYGHERHLKPAPKKSSGTWPWNMHALMCLALLLPAFVSAA